MQTKQKLRHFQHEDVVICVQLHENWLITCSVDKSTRIWDLGDGKQIKKFEQSDKCGNLDISPSKLLLAIASGHELVLVDISKTTKIKEFKLGTGILDVRFNQSGTRLIVGLHEGEVFKIDLIFDSEKEEYDTYQVDKSSSQMQSSSKSCNSKGLKLFRKLFKKNGK